MSPGALVDAHCHLEPELPAERLVAAMDAAGVERAVLIAAAQAPIRSVPRLGTALFRGCVGLPGVGLGIYRRALRSRRIVPIAEPDNAAVFAAARAYPDRFLPFVFLNPALGAERTRDEFDRWYAEGAVGVKLHPWLHRYRLVDALPILRPAARAGIPVLAHLGTGPPEDIDGVLHHVRGIKLILAHAGIPYQDERSWKHRGVWFDVAAPLVSERTMRRLVDAVGPGRVIYGSDAPIGLRDGGAHAYRLPPLPDPAMGDTLLSLLD